MPSLPYILIAIVTLIVLILLLLFIVRRDRRKENLTPLAGLAFAFILAGILFGEQRTVGYSLLGVGLVFAVIDMVKKLRHKS